MKATFERLRKNSSYIGRIVFDEDGTKYVQVSRAPSVGTIVCTGLDENDEPKLGWVLISPNEKKENIDWEATQKIAIDRANGVRNDAPFIPNSLKKQVEHFKERSKAYFNPKKYSKKNQKRPGKLLKVWVNDSDALYNTDLTKNITIKEG